MCDLNDEETRYIVEALTDISTLTAKVGVHASSIQETAFMDHEVLAEALGELQEKVVSTREWVVAKPQQHAGHQGGDTDGGH